MKAEYGKLVANGLTPNCHLCFIAASLFVCVFMNAAVQAQPKPAPSPTPRRALAKPVTGSRGFEQFAKRDASARLIAVAGTRVVIDPDDHFAKGEEHYKAGRYKAAVAELRQAVRLSPDWDDPHYVLALALTELGELQEAIEEYKRVIDLAIKDEPKILSYYNMGNAHFDLGEYENAIGSYEQAIKLDPTRSRPHNNLGLVYAALDRLEEAVTAFSEAVHLKKDYAEAHYNLGVVYFQMGKKKEAQEQQEALGRLKSPLAEKLGLLLKSN